MLSAFQSNRQRPANDPGRPRVLVIDDWLPDPRIGAGAPRALGLLRAITDTDASLTLLPTLSDPDDATDIQRLLPDGKVALGYGKAGVGRFLSERNGDFDLILVSRPHNMASFRAAVAAGQHQLGATPVVYDSEALFAAREALRRELLGKPMSAAELAREIRNEIALADGTRMVLTVTAREAASFRAANHVDVRVLGYAVAPQPTQAPFAERDGFLFVGPTYADGTPNADAVVWFADYVLPGIRRSMGRPVSFVHAGIQRSRLVAARANGALRPVGPMPDLTNVYSGARVFVAPVRFGAGIPIKVYDAAAYGLPVVLTPLLAEQLGWRHEEEALVADSPRDFAAQCLRLHADHALWEHIRARALQRVAQDCDPVQFNLIVADVLAHAT